MPRVVWQQRDLVQVTPRVKPHKGFGSDWEVACQQELPSRQSLCLELFLLSVGSAPPQDFTWHLDPWPRSRGKAWAREVHRNIVLKDWAVCPQCSQEMEKGPSSKACLLLSQDKPPNLFPNL